jgi:hypothetical protein
MNHIEVVTILKDLPVNVRMVCARRPGDAAPYRLIDTSQDRAAFAARVSAAFRNSVVKFKGLTLVMNGRFPTFHCYWFYGYPVFLTLEIPYYRLIRIIV